MIDPWLSPWSKFVYKRFHHEPFRPEARDCAHSRPLSGANGAIPWIVFVRDRHIFESAFSDSLVDQGWAVFAISLSGIRRCCDAQLDAKLHLQAYGCVWTHARAPHVESGYVRVRISPQALGQSSPTPLKRKVRCVAQIRPPSRNVWTSAVRAPAAPGFAGLQEKAMQTSSVLRTMGSVRTELSRR